MNPTKRTLQLLATVAALSALPAAAQQSPWYVGLSFGQSKTDDSIVANREATITNAALISSSFDDKDTAWRGLVGYRFNEMFSIEGNYANYGSSKIDTVFITDDGTNRPGGVATTRDVAGFGIDLVLTAPIGDRFSVFGRVGYVRVDVDTNASLSGNTVFNDGTSGTSRDNSIQENVARYGLGFGWNFAPNVTARLEWERLTDVGRPFGAGESNATGEADIDTVMLGVVWRF
jgi:opacity protein-like surface antigen